jgi:quercetin dioxygenase-like cupin family protein
MSPGSGAHERDHVESLCLYALQALPPSDVPLVEAQLAACAECRRELETLRPVVEAFVSWPTDLLRPSTSLWERLERRIGAPPGQPVPPVATAPAVVEWEEVAPGITCRLLATDLDTGRVSMLVRLAPGTEYPPHTHAIVEELHMLEGDLMVDDKKLHAGDYLRSQPGTTDRRVWTENGCMGVLITSFRDALL